MECDHSKLNGAVFGTHDLLNYLRDQAATYRKLVERAVDPLVKIELRALASVCDEIADNIEDGRGRPCAALPLVKAIMKEAAN
jgi:hypothetical protein